MCVWRGGKGLKLHSEILHCLRTVMMLEKGQETRWSIGTSELDGL